MQIITTTQLRTHTKQLTSTLAQGNSIELIHRSKIIGSIKPARIQNKKAKLSFSQAIEAAQKVFAKAGKSLPKDNERLMQVYRDRLLKKHG